MPDQLSLSSTGNPVIVFEPDGYQLSAPGLMGRQVAGYSFLRAVVAGRSGDELWAYTPHRQSAEAFAQLLRQLDPAVRARWCLPTAFEVPEKLGTLYFPGPAIDIVSRFRLRAGPAAYSLCGVTHTISSHRAMDSIVGLLTAPVMPWDALICTSKAVADAVEILLTAEQDFLRWRLGVLPKIGLPQLPVIPLGVHCNDFSFSAQQRSEARAELKINEDEVVALFVGRLSFHAKAHPYAMFAALQAAQRRTGKRIVLLQCGWFANAHIQNAYKKGAAEACPNVRCLFVDGRQQSTLHQSWAASDLFISLSDNIQESFGLTPVEAMAAGLPIIVTDWNGYKDTIRDGVDGFRIATWMLPSNSIVNRIARNYEAGIINYDEFCGLTCQMVSIDKDLLENRLIALISDSALRKQLGAAGRQRAREIFDWCVIYKQYQELWTELAHIRQSALRAPSWQNMLTMAPKVSASRMDPFDVFRHYSSSIVTPTTKVHKIPNADTQLYRTISNSELYKNFSRAHPPYELVQRLFEAMDEPSARIEGIDIETLASRVKTHLQAAVTAVCILSKMNMVRLE